MSLCQGQLARSRSSEVLSALDVLPAQGRTRISSYQEPDDTSRGTYPTKRLVLSAGRLISALRQSMAPNHSHSGPGCPTVCSALSRFDEQRDFERIHVHSRSRRIQLWLNACEWCCRVFTSRFRHFCVSRQYSNSALSHNRTSHSRQTKLRRPFTPYIFPRPVKQFLP